MFLLFPSSQLYISFIFNTYGLKVLSTNRNINKRIFCIGMNKTGTSTMGHCFKKLGLYPLASPTTMTPELTKELKIFFKTRNYDDILNFAENCKTFEDRPWNMWDMYRHIDKRFPDSLFILTVRNSDSWWRSTERWITILKPQMKKRYINHLNVDNVDRSSMVKSYEDHNQQIISYFKGSKKLLIMDLEGGDGWNKLCKFLDVPVPEEAFPHANKQAYTSAELKKIRELRRKKKGHTCQACEHVFLDKKSYSQQSSPYSSTKQRIKRAVLPSAKALITNNLCSKLIRSANNFKSKMLSNRKKELQRIKSQYPDMDINDFSIVSCFFNPTGSIHRVENFTRFLEGIKDSGVNYLVVELAFGTEPFSFNGEENIIQLRTNDVMWHKERLLNIGIKHLLNKGYKKIAWLDGDILFDNPDWPWFISAKLETSRLCQVFSTINIQVSKDSLPICASSSVKYYKSHNKIFSQPSTLYEKLAGRNLSGQSGFGWAATAEVLQKVQLYENAIVGGGDKLLFLASLMNEDKKDRLKRLKSLTSSHLACPKCKHRNQSESYTADFINWAYQWSEVIEKNVDYVSLQISDLYHGQRANRKYLDRKNILFKHQYNPDTDIKIDSSGCLSWTENTIDLQNDIKSYFFSRKDDF